jgi:hypothetical protein
MPHRLIGITSAVSSRAASSVAYELNKEIFTQLCYMFKIVD